MQLLSQNQYKFIRSLQQKKIRDIEGQFFVEGVRLCEELLASTFIPEYGIVCDQNKTLDRVWQIIDKAELRGIPVFETDSEKFASLADTRAPQGIAFVVKKQDTEINLKKSRLLVALDDINDPGNMGTIIRTAEWFGADGIITSPGSVDLYNPKVVRSAMGALFHIRFMENVNLESFLPELGKEGFVIAGAVPEKGIPLDEYHVDEPTVVLIGNEARGIHPALESLMDDKLTIPGYGKSESLNAAIAGGILFYHLTRLKGK